MNKITFFSENRQLLAFGLLTAFFSSFGQTFFIALYNPSIRNEFDLSHGDFGLIYSGGTIVSAVILTWLGRKIDFISLRLYTICVCAGLVVSCISMAHITSVSWLILIIFGLRLTGQGLLSHISSVSMARYFNNNRGTALSIASLGYPLGEAIFPPLVILLIMLIGWRNVWISAGITLILILIPSVIWLLKNHNENRLNKKTSLSLSQNTGLIGNWTRRQVVRNKHFYCILPSYLAISFIVTGFFFHQVHLVDSKGWKIELFATFFSIYAITQILASLITGILIDRFSAHRVMAYYLFPALLGLVFISAFDAVWTAALFMGLMGISSGASAVVNSAIMAELYGIKELGSIKALGTALMVFSTAVSPPIMGIAIDSGVSMEIIALMCSCLIIFSTILLFLLLNSQVLSNNR